MILKLNIWVTVVALTCTLAGGCARGPVRPHGFDDTPAPRRDRVLLLDRALRSQIRVDDIVAEWTRDGRLVAKLKIQNHADRPLHLMLQTNFLNRDGVNVEGSAVWEHVLLATGATHSHQLEALSRDAFDFAVQIRTATEGR